MPKRLVYLLDYNLKNEITCTTLTTTVIKRESISSATFKDIKHVMQASHQISLTALDRQIVMGLAMRSGRNEEAIVLYGMDSQEFLQTILKTKRAFWARSKKPALSLGKDVSGKLYWTVQQHDKIQPDIQVSGDTDYHVLATTPPAYFDPDGNQIGSLVFDVPGSAVTKWICKSPMTLEDAHKWFFKLKKDYPDASLPPPPALDVAVFQEQPQAILTIKSLLPASEHSPQKTRMLPFIKTVGLELSFKYGTATFDWDDKQQQAVMLRDGKVFTIQRDSAFEDDIVQKLASIEVRPEASAASFGMLSLYSKKFAFPDTIDQPLDQYLQKRFLGLTRASNIELVDSVQLLEQDFSSSIDIELKPNPDATFKLSAKDLQSRKPIDLVQILQDYLKTVPEMPLELLLKKIEKQTFTLIDNTGSKPVAIPGHQIVPLVAALFEIIIQPDYKANHIPLRLAAQLAIQAGNSGSGNYEDCVPESLIKYVVAWSRQQLPEKGAAVASDFNATLRAYQAIGVAWLTRVIDSGHGAILADEMGLGKTVQTLALLNNRKKTQKPTLLIAPSSLTSTWHDEATKFTPTLKVHVHHGKDRATDSTVFKDYALVITSYALLYRDAELYHSTEWDGIVLDEAHFVKNDQTKTYRAIEQINYGWCLCLTGTPVENHLSDLFSLFQLIVPGYLGRISDWKKTAKLSTSKALDEDAMLQLKREIAPFILRRTKEEVLTELPPKTEALVPLEFRTEERNAYNVILAATNKTIRDEVKRRGFAQSSITILSCLLRLRQCCCDPAMVESFASAYPQKSSNTRYSTKTQHLLDWLPELIRKNHKVLIFSSFAQYLNKLSQALNSNDLNHSLLTGSTVDRDKEIQKFRQGKNAIFLLSLKAGGYGLTLTEADIVIHCDPWWNPAVEAQASARIHRIGQDKPVFIYKLVVEGTIESRILELQEEKRSFANQLLSQDQEQWSLDETTLESLLKQ